MPDGRTCRQDGSGPVKGTVVSGFSPAVRLNCLRPRPFSPYHHGQHELIRSSSPLTPLGTRRVLEREERRRAHVLQQPQQLLALRRTALPRPLSRDPCVPAVPCTPEGRGVPRLRGDANPVWGAPSRAPRSGQHVDDAGLRPGFPPDCLRRSGPARAGAQPARSGFSCRRRCSAHTRHRSTRWTCW